MSYVNKKIRAFREAGDIEIQRKRSDGRMKTYQSATDARAWSDITEERRQHILELIRQGYGKGLSLGKYIPIEVIIDILLANKNADIERLQQRIKELEDFIKKNGLKKPASEPKETKKAVPPVSTQASKKEPKPETRGAEKKTPEESTSKGVSQADAQDKLGQTAALGGKKEEEEGIGQADTLGGKSKDEIGQEQDSGQAKIEPVSTGAEGAEDAEGAGGAESGGGTKGGERSAGVTLASEPVSAAPSLKEDALGSEEKKAKPTDDDTTTPFATAISDDDQPGSAAEKIKEESRKKEAEAAENAAKELLASKSPEEQQQALKEALEEKDKFYREQQSIAAESIEQLERIQDIVDEGDNKEKRRKQRAKVDPKDLRKRLDNLKGLEDEVKKLKGKALGAGDCGDIDKLKEKMAALERENGDLKGKLKEMDILRCEKECLKMRADGMSRIQKDYEDLLKKTQGFDALKAELARCKAKCEEMKDLEAENKELLAKLQRLDALENERALLLKEIENCECCMTSQDDEIKRLTCHIECLSQDLDKRQDQMKVKVMKMRTHLEKKDLVIAKSEQQLADVQDQLRNSIENLSCETSCLRHRIEELEDQAQESKERALKLQMVLDAKEESNKALLEKLENEKDTSSKLEDALKKAIKNDEHLKQMLWQAKCAIKCITQKLDKHDIIEAGKLEAERRNYLTKIEALEKELASERDKIKALEYEKSTGMGQGDEMCGADRIEQLEAELLKAKATIECLRENLDALTDETGA